MRKIICILVLLSIGCAARHPKALTWNQASQLTYEKARKEMPDEYAKWAFSHPQKGDEEWEPPFAYTDFDYMEREDQRIILNYWNRTIDIRKEIEHDSVSRITK